MNLPVVVVDTNVVVSGLLSRNPRSPTVRILDAMIERQLRFALSMDLVSEYRQVLLRPAIGERHGRTDREIDILLAALVEKALFRDPDPARPPLPPDPGDQHLWALARSVRDAILVTGDRRLLEAEDPGFSLLSPAALAELLGSGAS